jgi:hypothetical protein
MQSEEFDKKIQQAADHHHPAYDEQAWTKMEKLLNKHLPQKKDDRRRFIFFLTLFLLLGGSAAFLFINKAPHKESLASGQTPLQQITSVPKTVVVKEETPTSLSVPGKKIGAGNEKELTQSPVAEKPIQLQSPRVGTVLQGDLNKRNTAINQSLHAIKNKQPAGNNGTVYAADRTAGNEVVKNEVEKNNVSLADPAVKNNSSANTTLPLNTSTGENVIVKKEQQAAAITPEKTDKNKSELPVMTAPVAKNNKSSNKKTSSFFFSLSTAPDISAAGSSKSGKMKLTAGGGLGYTFHNRLTVRTGFYSGRKIYSADPDQYHPPKSAWTNYVDLKKIDADCRVYEIPLLVSYNFSHSAKQSWLGTIGLSSYLMKRETYNYLYKDQAGVYQYSSGWSLYDANKNYFSVITLSAGYQRNINNTFFIAAEPYLKIPFSGVGYGKVKLNSAGIQFSLGIRPFKAAKKAGPAKHE